MTIDAVLLFVEGLLHAAFGIGVTVWFFMWANDLLPARKKPPLYADYRPYGRARFVIWCLGQAICIPWAMYINSTDPEPGQPFAVVIFGGAIGWFLSLIAVKTMDVGLWLWGRKSRANTRNRGRDLASPGLD